MWFKHRKRCKPSSRGKLSITIAFSIVFIVRCKVVDIARRRKRRVVTPPGYWPNIEIVCSDSHLPLIDFHAPQRAVVSTQPSLKMIWQYLKTRLHGHSPLFRRQRSYIAQIFSFPSIFHKLFLPLERASQCLGVFPGPEFSIVLIALNEICIIRPQHLHTC